MDLNLLFGWLIDYPVVIFQLLTEDATAVFEIMKVAVVTTLDVPMEVSSWFALNSCHFIFIKTSEIDAIPLLLARTAWVLGIGITVLPIALVNSEFLIFEGK